MNLPGYDKWKLASPYDNEPADKFGRQSHPFTCATCEGQAPEGCPCCDGNGHVVLVCDGCDECEDGE